MTWNVNHKGKIPEGSPWTVKRMDDLKRLWAEGLSCSQVARILGGGLTRNAVIGKVHRMHLPARKSGKPVWRPRKEPREPRQRAQDASLVSKWRRNGPPRLPTSPLPKADAWRPLPGTSPVTLMEIKDGMCRWPIGDTKPFLFCGCPTYPGSPYCKTHADTSSPFPQVLPTNNTDPTKTPARALFTERELRSGGKFGAVISTELSTA